MASNELHPKLYKIRGAHFCRETQLTTFRVFAPNARNVSLILTAYGREEWRLKMHKNPSELWEIVTDKALPGRTYLYSIEDCHGRHMLRIDPVSFSVIEISETHQVHSIVHDPSAYQWGDEQWLIKRSQTNPLRSPLSIYEIQPKTWKYSAYQPVNYRVLAPQLSEYCHRMGFTHVEVYGLLEHTFKLSRGYQVANFFAPHHDNGQCDDLKYFVDHLHQNDIGVIIDWIPTHFHHYHLSKSFSMSLHEFDGTNLHGNSNSCWGTLYFDFSKEETYRLLFASALYFLDEIHFDGIRFDAVSGMIRRQSQDIRPAIAFLRELNQTIHRSYPGVLCIAEETDGYPNVNKTMDFDLKWNIGWCHDAMNLLRTPYRERPNHWHHKVLNMLNSARTNPDKSILTLSHDDTDCAHRPEEKSLLSCVSHSPNELSRFADLRNFFAWQVFGPSRGHMIHMGDELAQPISWYRRFQQGLSSVDWSLANNSTPHGKMQEYIADLNRLYLHHPQFWQNGEEDFAMIYEYGVNLIVAYHRGIHNQRRLTVIHNFSNRAFPTYDIHLPRSDSQAHRIRKMVEIFNSDNPSYGGSGLFQNRDVKLIHGHHGEMLFQLAIPPLATVLIEEHF